MRIMQELRVLAVAVLFGMMGSMSIPFFSFQRFIFSCGIFSRKFKNCFPIMAIKTFSSSSGIFAVV